MPCRALRVGFVGEVGFELHHERSRGPALYDALLETGRPEGAQPFGLGALDMLRLEKGHLYLGQDTLPDDHPAKLGLDWAVAMEKPGFVGKAALERMRALPLERTLVGLRIEDEPRRGVPLLAGGRVVGRVTSCARSEAVGGTIALGWIRATDGSFPNELFAAGHPPPSCRHPSTTPRGPGSVRELARALVGVVTASAEAGALDLLLVPGRALACRVVDDELLLLCAQPVTDEVAREVATRLAALDPDALVTRHDRRMDGDLGGRGRCAGELRSPVPPRAPRSRFPPRRGRARPGQGRRW